MIGRQSGLGRGLGALIPPSKPVQQTSSVPLQAPTRPAEPVIVETVTQVSVSGPEGNRLMQVPIHLIDRNPQQPRLHFDHQELEELIASIKEHGVLQPLVVTAQPDGRYQLIAGERRLRASTIAGLETVPAVVRQDEDDQKKLELAIIENVIRQDLNPIEEAKAYLRLMDEFGLTQDDVSKKMGKSRPQVANMVRLLQLPEDIQRALIERVITASNARTLLSLPSHDERMDLFQRMKEGNFTVRDAENEVAVRVKRTSPKDANVAAAEDRLREYLASRVQVKRNLAGEGEIRIKFYSDEEFNALLGKIAGE